MRNDRGPSPYPDLGSADEWLPLGVNLDGAVAIGDLLALLSDFANFCEGLD